MKKIFGLLILFSFCLALIPGFVYAGPESRTTISHSSSSSESGPESRTTTSHSSTSKCKTFGSPNNPEDFAYYLQAVFDIIRFLGPALVIIMTILDLVRITAEQKQDGELTKLGGKTLKRIIYAAIIFILPTLISWVFELI